MSSSHLHKWNQVLVVNDKTKIMYYNLRLVGVLCGKFECSRPAFKCRHHTETDFTAFSIHELI